MPDPIGALRMAPARGAPRWRHKWHRALYRGDLPGQNVPRDDDALDLARSLVDGGDAHVAVMPLDGKLVDVAVSSVDLNGDVAGPVGLLAGEDLRHRPLARERLARLFQTRRAQRQQGRSVELGCHVRQHELDGVVPGDRLSERLPL